MFDTITGMPSNVGQQLTQPTANPIGAADPKKMGMWQAFRQKLAQDPNLRMALLTTGINMMRNPGFGQNGFDVFADAATTGVGTLNTLRQQQQAGQIEQQKLGLEGRRVDQGDKQLGQTDRRIAQGDDELNLMRGKLAESVRQFESNLAEQKRQFDARLGAGDFSGSPGSQAGSTGPERMAELSYKALLDSGLYPKTEQGRGLARLRANGLIGKNLVNPQDRFAFISETAVDLKLFNKEMSEDEAVASATRMADAITKYSNLADPAAVETQPNPAILPPSDYSNHVVYDKQRGEGMVSKSPNGNYIVTFGTGKNKEMYEWTPDEMEAWPNKYPR